MDKGEIYLIVNKVNGKKYIGQAVCFSTNNRKWGTFERWKSHAREALGNQKDHCRLLNNAIRKYGEEKFRVIKLLTCLLKDLDYWEIEYIKVFKTLVPNGYNLKDGGSKGKDSIETRDKKRKMRLGKNHDQMTKLYISLGQYGQKRTKESSNLPMFIYAYKRGGKIKGYSVRYPIIENLSIKLLVKRFYGNSIEKAINYSMELEDKYHTKELINKIKNEKKNNMNIKRQSKTLPNYIFPIFKENKKIGYVVKNFLLDNDTICEKKEFISSNQDCRNLNNAKKYLKQLNIQKDDMNFVIPQLPKHLVFTKDTSSLGKEIKGFKILNFPFINEKGEKILINKKFTNMSISLSEKYKLIINYYNKLNNA